ncbi:MAG: hypothetical protein HY726_13695 [Candidatus Rokubacteria bacterium]|nr:hypothetical protein [Candidatus Rokubacteria bacterium]
MLYLTLAGAGCATAWGYFGLPQDERRLFEVYSAFMTTAQQNAYVSQPGREARTVYAESLGLPQRLAALPAGEREAVLEAQIIRGMSAEGLLMALGHPRYRSALGRGAEKWVYFPYDARHLPPSAGMTVYLRDDRVTEWVQFVIPAPEGKR